MPALFSGISSTSSQYKALACGGGHVLREREWVRGHGLRERECVRGHGVRERECVWE